MQNYNISTHYPIPKSEYFTPRHLSSQPEYLLAINAVLHLCQFIFNLNKKIVTLLNNTTNMPNFNPKDKFDASNCDLKSHTLATANSPQTILIEDFIHVIRGQQVMLDSDLARLYGVETGQLNRQVKRNIERFPEDFMFKLTNEEVQNLKCQIGTSKTDTVKY